MTRDGGARAALNSPATGPIVSRPTDIERARRRWRLHQQFVTRPAISAALDEKCGVSAIADTEIDYDAMGFTLTFEERRARGLVLLEQERAA